MHEPFRRETVELDSVLRRVGMLLNARSKRIMQDVQITFPQFMVLMTLGNAGEAIMTDLVERTHMAPPTATGIVDRLVSQELVERFRSDEDRRVVKVRMTEKGRSVLERVRNKRLELFEADVKVLTEEDRKILIELLERLYDSIKTNFEKM